MDLPTFRYHPDPIASGSVVASDVQCLCCNERRGFIYAGPAYCKAELEEAICPWCIANGSAHRKFDASFVDEACFPADIPPNIVEEVCFRTPSFIAWQQEKWLTCCSDAAAFLEPAGHADIRARYPQLEGALMMYVVHEIGISGSAATRFLAALDRDQGPTAYVFSCRHCDNKPVYVDYL
jgi:uncharacterized protein